MSSGKDKMMCSIIHLRFINTEGGGCGKRVLCPNYPSRLDSGAIQVSRAAVNTVASQTTSKVAYLTSGVGRMVYDADIPYK